MINVSCFCPFGRITDLFMPLCRAAGIKRFTINFDEFPECSLSVDTAKYNDNVQPRSSLAQRRKALDAEKITGWITFQQEVDGTSIPVSRSFVCENVLLTDAPGLPTSNGSNGVFGGDADIRYVEATHVHNDLRIESGKQARNNSLRPFYQYVNCGKNGDGVYHILGPACVKLYETALKVTCDKLEYSIYSLSDLTKLVSKPSGEPVPVSRPIIVSAFSKIFLRMHSNDKTWIEPYKFAQNAYRIDGHAVEYSTQLDILKIAVFREIADSRGLSALNKFVDGGNLIIDLRFVKGVWTVTQEVHEFILEWISWNTDLNEVFFKHIYASPAGIFVEFPDRLGYLAKDISSGKASSACFALSLSYYFALFNGGGIRDFVNSFNSLLLYDWLRVETDEQAKDYQVIYGFTGDARTKTKSLKVAVDNKLIEKQFTRRDYTWKDFCAVSPNVSGFAMLGFDYDVRSHDKGPDHYIVVQVIDGRIYTIYDPLTGSHGRADREDVTDFLRNSEAYLITFVTDGKNGVFNES